MNFHIKNLKMRKLIWLCLLTANATILLTACTNQQKKSFSGSEKPNIILVLVDDLGYGDIEPYGQKLIETPHLNEMTKEGMKFTDFYTSAPVCAPARASLISGLHTGHSPIRGNKEVKPEGQWPIPDSLTTIAEVLKKSGYSTGAYGKWGMGFVGSEGDPNKQGFDEFFGYNCQREAHNYYPDHLWHNNNRIDYPKNPKNKYMYSGDKIHENAMNFINSDHDKPFFLYLAYTLPHAALQLPEDSIFKKYVDKFKEKPKPVDANWKQKGLFYEPQAYPKAAHAAMVSRIDSYVGDILKALKEKGLDKNTLVIFTSDNGPHVEGGHQPAFFNSSGSFRGVKRDVYEGGIRMPFIAWWPGTIAGNSESRYIGAFYDLLPTFADLAGADAPKNIDGISFVKALTGNKSQQVHKYLYWEFHGHDAKQAVRMGKWKGVILDAHKKPKNDLQLYNLETDPYEKNNLASEYPEIVKQLAGFIELSHSANKDYPMLDN